MGTVEGNMAMAQDGSIAKPGAPPSDGSSTVGFQVDREQIPEVIKDLKVALEALMKVQKEAQEALDYHSAWR